MLKHTLRFALILGAAMMVIAAVSCNKQPAGVTALMAIAGADGADPQDTTDPQAPTITAKYDRVQIFDGKPLGYDTLVTVSSDSQPVKLTVDTQAVDLATTGTYTITYTATDAEGRSRQLSQTLDVFAPKQRVAFLTFDDGPSVHTPEILDILARYDVKATFFVIGQNKKYYSYMAREHKEGHTVAAHSFTHDYNIYSSEAAYFADLARIEVLIKQYTGRTSPLVRLPGGSSNHMYRRYHPGDRNFMHRLVDEMDRRGYISTDWNDAGQDASGNHVPVEKIVGGALNSEESGARRLCLLFHDAVGKETTVQALPQVIEGLKARGYVFAPLTQFSPRFQHFKPGSRAR